MSKKFKGKPCVYCNTADSQSADHVFARQFLMKARRQNLPKVPACLRCNTEKAELERYLTTLLPFGAQHSDASENLETMVPKRLAHNPPLHEILQRDRSRVWTRLQSGITVPTMALPLDWEKLERLFQFIVKGLTWYHWGVILGSGCTIDVVGVSRYGEQFIQRLLTLRARRRAHGSVGEGTFVYEGALGTDNPMITVWMFQIYGGVRLTGDPRAPGVETDKIAVLTGPQHIASGIDLMAKWRSGRAMS